MRQSQIKKIPITLILGDKEIESKKVSYRLFGSDETQTKTIEALAKEINEKIIKKQ